MGMIGNQLAAGVGSVSIANDSFNGNGSTTVFTLSQTVSAVTDIEVLVDNVQQSPYDSSYSVSGTTLTFSAAPAAGTNNIYVIYNHARTITTNQVVPDDGSVVESKLGAAAVTHTKLHTDLNLTGKTVKLASIVSSGGTTAVTIDSSGRVFKPAQPSFHANKSGHLAEINGTNRIESWTTTHNIGSHYNQTTGVFTAPVAGIYFFAMNWMHNNPGGDLQLHGYKNSSVVIRANQTAAGASWNQDYLGALYQMSANDTWSWHLYSSGTSTYGVYGGNAFTSCNGYLVG